MTSLSDNYNGARQLTWVPIDLYGGGAYSYDLVTDHLLGGGGTGAPANQNKAEQTGATTTDQQEVSETFTITGDLSNETSCWVISRKDPSASVMTYYSASYINNTAGGGWITIGKRLVGVETSLLGLTDVTGWALGVPHILKIRITGTTITQLDCFIDGVLVGTTNDASSPIIGNKYAGHGSIEISGGVNVAFKDFLAQDIGASPSGDPTNLVVTQVGSDAHLVWDTSTGALDYSIFRRTPQTGALFVPESDTPLASGISALSYTDDTVGIADYDYQVFGRLT